MSETKARACGCQVADLQHPEKGLDCALLKPGATLAAGAYCIEAQGNGDKPGERLCLALDPNDPRDADPTQGMGPALARGDRLRQEHAERQARAQGKFGGFTENEKELIGRGLMTVKKWWFAQEGTRREREGLAEVVELIEDVAKTVGAQ